MPSFTTSNAGKLLFGAAGARKPTVGALGESHGQYFMDAIQLACYRHYAADILMDTRTFANGGSQYAVGGTRTNTLANSLLGTQIPNFQTRPTDIAFICSGYNDLSDGIAPTTIRDNVLTAANACLAAGAMVVVIVGMMPRNGGVVANMASTMQVNGLYKKMCAANPRLVFLEVTNLVADPTSVNAYRGTQGNTFGSYSSDGTHLSARGQRAIAPAIANILKLFCAERKPRGAFPAGAYDPVNSPYINLLGDAGSMMGTSGLLNDATIPGTIAGISSASRMNISDGGGTLVTAIVTDAADGGRRKQRMTFSGTQTGNPYIRFDTQVATANAGDATRLMDYEAVVDFTGVTGFSSLTLRPNGSGTSDVLITPGGLRVSVSDTADSLTERWFVYNTYPVAVPASNPGLQMYFLNPSNNLAGQIEVSQVSGMLV